MYMTCHIALSTRPPTAAMNIVSSDLRLFDAYPRSGTQEPDMNSLNGLRNPIDLDR
jgi:hypothetical protein